MLITPDWKDAEGKGLIENATDYEYEGSIVSEEDIHIALKPKNFVVKGSLKAKGSITADRSLIVGEDLVTDGNLLVTEELLVLKDVSVGWNFEVEESQRREG